LIFHVLFYKEPNMGLPSLYDKAEPYSGIFYDSDENCREMWSRRRDRIESQPIRHGIDLDLQVQLTWINQRY